MTHEKSGSTSDDLDLGKVLAALSDPHRREVVATLAAAVEDVERTCASFNLPVSKSTITHHFKALVESGLVTNVDYGNRRGVLLRRCDLDERFPGLLNLLVAENAQRADTGN
jgi:DNA-binding transcriptional ArsR family regulator